MPRYGQLVIGPAGSGKSTYCSTMARHAQALRRPVQVVNLDPAAQHFDYPLAADIRELIRLDDVTEEGPDGLGLGPNGGLVFCMEYLGRHLDWLEESLGQAEDDYVLLDCPGQMELYAHLPVMRQLAGRLQQRCGFRLCAVFLVDAQFAADSFKLASGVMAALSAMASLELPQVNVLTKMDLLVPRARRHVERMLLEPDGRSMAAMDDAAPGGGGGGGEVAGGRGGGRRLRRLTEVICGLIDDYAMVRFLPLDRRDQEEVDSVLQHIDMMIQYGEDLEVREPREV